MINVKVFNPSLIKIDKKSYKNIGIYHIGYIRKKDEYKINSLNPLYLIISEVAGYIESSSIEENHGNKYLTFASTEKKSVRRVYKSLG